jgi:hypothetical protein
MLRPVLLRHVSADLRKSAWSGRTRRLVINAGEGALGAAIEGLDIAQSCEEGSRREVESGFLIWGFHAG